MPESRVSRGETAVWRKTTDQAGPMQTEPRMTANRHAEWTPAGAASNDSDWYTARTF